jgi:hypothetical protein
MLLDGRPDTRRDEALTSLYAAACAEVAKVRRHFTVSLNRLFRPCLLSFLLVSSTPWFALLGRQG